MKLNISLKDEQKEFMDQIVSDFSLGEIEISIQNLVKEILNQDDNRGRQQHGQAQQPVTEMSWLQDSESAILRNQSTGCTYELNPPEIK